MEFELSTDLIEIKRANALEVFTTPSEVEKIIAMLAEKANAALANLKDVGLYDTSTEEGRAAIKALAFKVTKSKTALETAGKSLAKEAKELPRKIDAGRGRFDEELDRLAKQIRKPVTDWEADEEKRKSGHLSRIDQIKSYGATASIDMDQETLLGLQAAAVGVEVGPQCEEFEEGYELARSAAINSIHLVYGARVKYDQDQAELAHLRELEAARAAQEAEHKREHERKEYETRIAREATEAAQRAARAEMQRELDRANAALVEQQEDEKWRIEQERLKAASIAEEDRRRQASHNNRKKVNGEAVIALMKECSFLTEDEAKAVVKAIAMKLIPAIRLEY